LLILLWLFWSAANLRRIRFIAFLCGAELSGERSGVCEPVDDWQATRSWDALVNESSERNLFDASQFWS
jgi:hypothetical protein